MKLGPHVPTEGVSVLGGLGDLVGSSVSGMGALGGSLFDGVSGMGSSVPWHAFGVHSDEWFAVDAWWHVWRWVQR